MRKGRVYLSVAVIVGALAWVAVKGLTNSLVYYKTPTQIVQEGATGYGQQVRLGGYVLPGTVHDLGNVIKFEVTDGTTRMEVWQQGTVPALFKAGQGVVVEGYYGRDRVFHSNTVLVKHNGVYQPPAPGETPTAANLAGAGG